MNKIYNIKNEKVMLDSDLAEILKIETKQLNKSVKRHSLEFKNSNRFQLTNDEFDELKLQKEALRFQNGTLKNRGKHTKFLPFVFTKNGVQIVIKILKKNIDLTYLFEAKQEVDLMLYNDNLRSKIHNIRGLQVMIDYDLAILYQVDTKRINEQVKRNSERFPETYKFQLNEAEKNELVANCDQLFALKHSSVLPTVFTEHGIAMLASVLHSDVAIKMSLKIIDTFMNMRKFIADNANVFHRLNYVENKLQINDVKFNEIFDALEEKHKQPTQGIFYAGQIFDAYRFISDLVRKPQSSIVLIDNYIDDTVLTLFSKRNKNVSVIIYTQYISKELKLDLQKHNAQYPPIKIKILKDIHDRFLILDDNEIYHIGASLKDLGKKLFGFSRFDKKSFNLMNKLKSKKLTTEYTKGHGNLKS